MGWLRLVGSLKLWVSFAKEPYKRDIILQKRPIILRSLLIVATPYSMSSHEWLWVSLSSRHECLSLRHEWLWVSLSSWETSPMSSYKCLSPRDISGFECLSLRVTSPEIYLVLQPSSFSAIICSSLPFTAVRAVECTSVSFNLYVCACVCVILCILWFFSLFWLCWSNPMCGSYPTISAHTTDSLRRTPTGVPMCVCMRRGEVIKNWKFVSLSRALRLLSSFVNVCVCVYARICVCVGCVYLEKLINIAFKGEIGHELRWAEFLRSFKRICSVRVCVLRMCVRVCVYVWMRVRMRVHMRVCAWGFMCLHSGACVFVCV